MFNNIHSEPLKVKISEEGADLYCKEAFKIASMRIFKNYMGDDLNERKSFELSSETILRNDD